MSNGKKPFFDERGIRQIKGMRVKEVKTLQGLVQEIEALDPTQEAISIQANLIPEKFLHNMKTEADAARKWYRHGNYVNLPLPASLNVALEEKKFPHELREQVFDSTLGRIREEDIKHIGYEFRPIQGPDKRKRRVSFAGVLEGVRMFCYAMSSTTDKIGVKPYDNAEGIESVGAHVMVSIPSRREKESRYRIRLSSIAIKNHEGKFSIWRSLASSFEEGRVPADELYRGIGYKFITDQEQAGVLWMGPHTMAGYLGVAQHYMLQHQNTTPWDMNPFPKPSQKMVAFDNAVRNNVIIRDRSGTAKAHRKLYHPERSLLLARFVGLRKTNATLFWEATRDPKITQYDWSIPQAR